MARKLRRDIIMATINETKDSIKTDVRELANIAIEDKISKYMIKRYRSFADIHYKDTLEEILKHDLAVSNITGINEVSKRFSEKLLSVLSKYQENEERKLIFQCINLIVDHESKRR